MEKSNERERKVQLLNKTFDEGLTDAKVQGNER